jgi:eukaryotic-like serine/threonine-protein kinase
MTDARSSQMRAAAAGHSSRRGAGSIAEPASTIPPDEELTVISTRGPFTEADDGPLLQPLEVGKMLEGERLGQFVLQNFVGGGGMGVVFKALDTTLNREVAVKVLARSQSQDEETLRRFQNEAQSAARLDHDNIARVYYVGQDRGVHYIVFEFIEGVNIRDLVQQIGPLSLADAVSYTLQVAEALSHASQRDVIHRDIKPSNVLITPDGKAKLVDMGLARLHQVDHTDHDLTASGVTLGTFDYISPEQARDPRSADVRSDLYSLGCSFYFMLTGRPPFPEGTVLQKLLQHQGEEPPDPRNFRPDLPEEVAKVLARLLAKNPARRYQLPAELISELSIVGERAGIPSTAFSLNYRPTPVQAPPAAWEHHLPWLLPLTALVVIVLALDFFWSESGELASPAIGGVRSSDEAGAAPLPRPAVAPKRDAAAPPAPRGSSIPAVNRFTTAPVSSPPVPAGPTRRVGPTRTSSGPGSLTVEPPLAPLDAPAEPPALAMPPRASLGNLAEMSRSFWSGDLDLSPLRRLLGIDAESQSDAQTDARAGTIANVAASPLATPSFSEPDPALGGKLAAPQAGVLVVALDRQGPGIYSSLLAALIAAKPGDAIELDFDGRHEQRPLTLNNTSVLIRAASGRRPVVAFRPADADPIGYPRSMLTIAGGSLTLSGVQLELDVPRRISGDTWTLIETRRAESVRIEQSVLTIRNAASSGGAFHPAVAFLDVKAPPGSESMSMTNPLPPSAIEVVDSFVRGEATFLRSDELEPVRLRVVNSLLATSETVLLARGATGSARAGAATEFDLRHVTALALGGLVRMANDEDSAHLPATQISCDESILIVAPGVPLVEQRGVDTPDRFRDRLRWSAEHVDFAGTELFWHVANVTSGQSVEFSFADWENYWGPSRELGCHHRAHPWATELYAQKSLSRLVPADLAGATSRDPSDEDAQRQIGCDNSRLLTPTPEFTPPAE